MLGVKWVCTSIFKLDIFTSFFDPIIPHEMISRSFILTSMRISSFFIPTDPREFCRE